MMDKINDNMNANGQQKLSMEDLEKVNGGIDGLTDKYGNYRTEKEVFEFGRSMVQSFGYDIAGEMMCTLYMVSPIEAKKQMSGDRTDIQEMDCLICQIFKIHERTSNGGNSY